MNETLKQVVSQAASQAASNILTWLLVAALGGIGWMIKISYDLHTQFEDMAEAREGHAEALRALILESRMPDDQKLDLLGRVAQIERRDGDDNYSPRDIAEIMSEAEDEDAAAKVGEMEEKAEKSKQ